MARVFIKNDLIKIDAIKHDRLGGGDPHGDGSGRSTTGE
jgi:hypothetical protein